MADVILLLSVATAIATGVCGICLLVGMIKEDKKMQGNAIGHGFMYSIAYSATYLLWFYLTWTPILSSIQ